jgi:hypothetical protein
MDSTKQTTDTWDCSDLFTASFLMGKGHPYEYIPAGAGLILVQFKSTPELRQDLDAYANGEKVSASAFAMRVKATKGAVLSLKRNGKGYASRNDFNR